MKKKKRGSNTCPIERVVTLVGDHCSILIVRDLLKEPQRFTELQESLRSSSRTLAIKLKHLEAEGIIERRAFDERPPRVEYRLTRRGKALHKVVETMRVYGAKYLS